MGWFSNLWGGGGGGDSGGTIQPREDYPYKSAEDLYNWASKYRKDNPYDPAKPYEGTMTAPMTGTEGRVQSGMENIMQQPMQQPMLGQASQYTSDVLQGKYDPRTSPYYTAMKKQIMADATETKANLLHQSAVGGMLHSDPRRKAETDLAAETTRDLMSLLGGVYEKERDRMGQSVTQAAGLAELAEKLPLSRMTTGATIGAIPREWEQGGLDREYNEYLRQLQGAQYPYDILQGISGRSYEPYNAQPYHYGQSGGSGGLSSWLNLGSSIAPIFGKLFK